MPVNKKDIIPDRYEKKLKECFQPTEELMAAMCKRWHLKVLFALEENDDEPMRFKDIRKVSGCTSEKMMNEALIKLEFYQLIEKKVNAKDPQHPVYRLRERGRTLLEILHPLEDWVDSHKRDFARELMEKKEKERRKKRS